jgi:CRP-like cAMP-binding protein
VPEDYQTGSASLDKVLGKMEECSFNAGSIIFSQGEQADSFYLIESGSVEVVVKDVTGNPETVAVLGPQYWFGEMGLLSGEPRSASVITVKETVLWKLSRDAWDEVAQLIFEWHSTDHSQKLKCQFFNSSGCRTLDSSIKQIVR